VPISDLREASKVALVLAGPPTAVDYLLSDRLTTFLRPADRHDLRDVPLDEVAQAIQSTVTAHGRAIDSEALDLTTQSTGGYPFMIQLVGYHVWRKTAGDVITTSAATAGIDQARSIRLRRFRPPLPARVPPRPCRTPVEPLTIEDP
jgi:hypothetical protein